MYDTLKKVNQGLTSVSFLSQGALDMELTWASLNICFERIEFNSGNKYVRKTEKGFSLVFVSGVKELSWASLNICF